MPTVAAMTHRLTARLISVGSADECSLSTASPLLASGDATAPLVATDVSVTADGIADAVLVQSSVIVPGRAPLTAVIQPAVAERRPIEPVAVRTGDRVAVELALGAGRAAAGVVRAAAATAA